jgi:hypothetical protein
MKRFAFRQNWGGRLARKFVFDRRQSLAPPDNPSSARSFLHPRQMRRHGAFFNTL